MGMVIQHMASTQIAVDKQQDSLKKLKKASERLSSGYRINRAADDAAGLAVSEKLRSIRRGLRQGLRNIEDGIGFVRTVEGASQEIHNMLHRLKELAVQSANGTYDDDVDREALDLEYQQILDEIDQMTDNADFNGVPLFEKHLSAFEMNEGDVRHDSAIKINNKNDTLVLGYTIDGVEKQITVDIPHGTYSAEETADIIDTYLFEHAPELIIGVNTEGQFTMQAEGGSVDNISGNAASLFYNTVVGSSDGYLMGVTYFPDVQRDEVVIKANTNDVMSFRVGNTDDTLYSVTIAPGSYTRAELIDAINAKIGAAGIPGNVRAVACENDDGQQIIGLASDSTITGLSGNFIRLDGETSPIYDISFYGEIDNSPAELSGAKRIPDNMVIERNRNDYFVLNLKYYGDDASQKSGTIRIDLLSPGENEKVYATPADLISTIQQQLDDAGYPFTASINGRGGIQITSDQFGKKCEVRLNSTNVPSKYMIYDLFDAGSLNVLTPRVSDSSYTRASFTAYKKLGTSVYIPPAENTLSFNITVSDTDSSPETNHRVDVVIPSGTYSTTDALVQTMNDYLDINYPDIADKLQFSIDASNTLKLYAEGSNSSKIERIEIDPTSSAYYRLVGGATYHNAFDFEDGYEEPYITSSDQIGGGGGSSSGRNNVTMTSGTTIQGTSESPGLSVTQNHQQAQHITYSDISPSAVKGTYTYKKIENVAGPGEIVDQSPATLTLPGILTQYSVPGTSSEARTLRFTLVDDTGSYDYEIDIPAGTDRNTAINMIASEVGDRATVSTSGSDLTITTKYEGDLAEFTSVSGSALTKASESSLARKSGAVIDKDANMVYLPAKSTISNALSRIPYTADASNDRLIMTAGKHSYDLTLTHKTYSTLQELADEINAQIAAADGGTAATTFEVDSNGKSLVITAPLKETGGISIDDASTCRIAYTLNKVPTSTPNYNPATGNVENPASMRAEGISSHFPKTVDSTNNTITMDYTHPDTVDPTKTVTETLTITIPDGTYNNASEFTNAVNSAIAADPALSGKITASYADSGSNKGLTFKTVNGGAGYELSNLGGTFGADKYINKADTTGGTVDAGANVVKYPASAFNEKYSTLFTGSGLEIKDSNDHVALTINGTLYEFDIAHGTYKDSAGSTSLTEQIRNGLSAAGVTVTDSGGTLMLVTDAVGNGTSIRLAASNTAPCFMRAENIKAPISAARDSEACYIIGGVNCSSIEIRENETDMSFDYSQDGNTYKVDVSVSTGTYTAASLAQAIQDSINQTLPAGALEVYVNSYNNIGIKSGTITPLRSISNFSGNLFDTAFQTATYRYITPHDTIRGDSSDKSRSYIIGRNDLSPETAEEMSSGSNVIIYPALNDQFIFDLQYNGIKYKVELTIPAGEYGPQELAAAIEQAGRDTLNNLTDQNGDPFPQDAFRATIGLKAIGTSENNTSIKSEDKLVLSFGIPDDGKVDDMLCIIDGVRGSAAYRIFYAATQSPTPSKVIGKADLTNGVMITAGENDTLSYTLDGTEYSVTIPEDTYTCDELYEYLNGQYEAMGSMVRCTNMDGHLMFYTIENGAYDIDVFKGNAADTLFYGGEKRESDSEIGIHTGRRTDTYIWYLRTRVDDHLMRINTTGITTAERAIKAMDRVDAAVNYLSRWRALSGANENRSRHTYERNTEYIANLESADAELRDADIAKEAAELAKQQILIQAQNAMIEQSKQQHSSIMDVLA